jgi:hypothetical protein
LSRPIIARLRNESRQQHRIIASGNHQPTSATKSAQSEQSSRTRECPLSGDAVEKGLVIFGEQWFRLLRLLAAEVCHDGPTEGRSEPAFLSV